MIGRKTFALLVAALAATTAAAQPRPPNFVLILMDDMGWKDLGVTGSLYHQTPNIDKIARAGMLDRERTPRLRYGPRQLAASARGPGSDPTWWCRPDASNGALAYYYNPFVVDASLTYTLDKFPLYRGAFPIRVGGEYMVNPAASDITDDYGFHAGVMFGKSGKKGTWDLTYTYKWLGGDAWYEELVDSDFGALSPRANPNRGEPAGYVAGTNTRGHIFRFAYSPTDALTVSAKWFLTDLMRPLPAAADSEMNRIQVDAMLKF